MDNFEFNPELELNQQELADLTGIYGQPGFKVLNKIHRNAVDWFIKQCINTDAADKDKVLSRHMQMQTAAKLYTLLLDNVNNIVVEHIQGMPSTKPVEGAPGLDFGEDAVEETVL
jgi:hypothetical protein